MSLVLDSFLEPIKAIWFMQPSCGRCGVRLKAEEGTQTCAHCGAQNEVRHP
jgi:hypothetical protein